MHAVVIEHVPVAELPPMLGDALIAATTLDHGLPVLTAKVKHFGAVQGLTRHGFGLLVCPTTAQGHCRKVGKK